MTTMSRTWVLCFALMAMACGSAVPAGDAGGDAGSDMGTNDAAGTVRFGAPCSETMRCRAGLQCSANLCQPLGNVPQGGRCVLTADCMLNLYCGAMGTCVQPGNAAVDEACVDTSSCIRGAVCHPLGAMPVCSVPRGSVIAYFDGATHSGPPGEGHDVDGSCESVIDCIAGLVCTAGRCTAPGP